MLTALLALILSTAHADEADKAACDGLSEGDACVRGDGDDGTCQLDASDDVLSCDDDAAGGGGDGGAGCDHTPSAPPWGAAAALALLGARRRR